MQFIQGQNREQLVLIPDCLDALIASDNQVRVIDMFVDSLKLADYQFTFKQTKEGRPAYHPKDLLKLFIYGYLNSIRSSRKLETECTRNIELMWLMKQLVPDHNTISNFRRDNEKAIRKVFRATVKMAAHFELIGGTLIAGDSTKLRAQNSKKNNFNPKKIERHLTYIENKLTEYNEALNAADGVAETIAEIKQNITKQQKRKAFYNDLTQQLEQSGDTQVSTSDTQSRQMITRNNITEVAYNIQTTVDAKHCIPVDYKVTNENDSKAMGGMLRRAKTILNTSDFTALYDKGYHTGSEIKAAIDMGIDIMVAIPEVASNAPDTAYNVANFIYDSPSDSYTCPQAQILITNGKWYKKDRGKSITLVKHYKTKACLNCPAFVLCTQNQEGRLIERSEHAAFIEQNRLNIEANPKTYKKRQAIVEHPYGIIKRQWGFYYIMTKQGIKRASADVGLMLIAYNLKRMMNILDPKVFKSYLKQLARFIFVKIASVNLKSGSVSSPNFKFTNYEILKIAA